MSISQLFELTIDGTAAELRISRVHGEEAIHRPFAFEVVCTAVDGGGARVDLDPRALVTKPSTLSFPVSEDSLRTVEGLVDAIEASDTGYRIRIVPRVALLADAVDHQIFVEKDAVEIATAVLGEHGLSVDNRVTRSLVKRPQCAQAFESDLAFVSRVLAEEGIAWYLPVDQPDRLIFTDQASGHEDVPGVAELSVREAGGLGAAPSVFRARIRRATVPSKVYLRDYNFEKPLLDLSVEEAAGGDGPERYEYPGRFADPDAGKELAKLRLEALRARRILLTAETTCRSLAPGYVISLADSPEEAINARWLIVEIEHRSVDQGAGDAGEDRYVARFTAVPAGAPYRPERPEAPRLGGVQTATVTGPGGSEIHTEEYGRTKVLHRWDRRRPKDDTSSGWIRVVNPPTSGGFFLPRVGWEALLGFFARGADAPVVLGRLYNGQAVPPEGLPGKKVASSFGTLTTPGGGSGNKVSTDDTAGNEGMSFVASKDFNERTEDGKNTTITAADSWTVGANRTLIVGQVLNQAVDGAQTYTVAATRTVNVTSNKMVDAASESILIGGLRTLNIGGDLVTGCASLTRLVGAAKAEVAIEQVSRAVKGSSTTLVGGSWSTVAGASHGMQVLGASVEAVGGVKSIKSSKYNLTVKGAYNETLASRSVTAGADRQEGFGAAASYSIGGSATIKGANVTVTATSKITIKAGGVTIEMTPSSIKISGDFKGKVEGVDNGKVDYE